MAAGETTEESETDMEMEDYKECAIELSDMELKIADTTEESETDMENKIEVKECQIELSNVELKMRDETTTEESEFEVDEELERAMSNSTATAGSVKMVACPYEGCPWFSSKPKRLPRHLLTHTGERPFACRVSI